MLFLVVTYSVANAGSDMEGLTFGKTGVTEEEDGSDY